MIRTILSKALKSVAIAALALHMEVAGTFVVPGLGASLGFFGQGEVLDSGSYITTVTDSAGGTSFTFNSTSFGNPSTNRRIYVMMTSAGTVTGNSVSSFTIGGVSVTKLLEKTRTHADTAAPAVAGYVDLASGSSGTVAITFSQTVTGVAIHLYRVVTPNHTVFFSGYESRASSTVNKRVMGASGPSGSFIIVAGSTTSTTGTFGTSVDTDGSNTTFDTLTADYNAQIGAVAFKSCCSHSLSGGYKPYQVINIVNTAFGIARALVIVVGEKETSPAKIYYAGYDVDTTDGTSYTFLNKAIGSPASNRHVIVGVCWNNSTATRTLSPVTIAGNNMTSIVANSTTTLGAQLFRYNLTTGNVADISLTFDATVTRVSIYIWVLYASSGVPTTNGSFTPSASTSGLATWSSSPADSIVISCFTATTTFTVQTGQWGGQCAGQLPDYTPSGQYQTSYGTTEGNGHGCGFCKNTTGSTNSLTYDYETTGTKSGRGVWIGY